MLIINKTIISIFLLLFIINTTTSYYVPTCPQPSPSSTNRNTWYPCVKDSECKGRLICCNYRCEPPHYIKVDSSVSLY